MEISMSQKRIQLQISGRVQGVFFRASARETALRLGVTGWVKNRSDGSVEVVAEGEEAAVDNLVAWCGQGPPGAMVHEVEVHREDPTGEFSSFRILY